MAAAAHASRCRRSGVITTVIFRTETGQYLLHVIDIHRGPAPGRFQGTEELAADHLLALPAAARIADFQHGRAAAVQRDVRTAWPGDVVVVELVCAEVDGGAPDPNIGAAALFVPEGRAQFLLDQADQVIVPR